MTVLVNPYRFSSGPTTLVYDTFTDSDSTALASHTPDIDTVGGGWTASNGTWDIQSNQANNTGSNPGGPNWIATIDCGVSDCEFSIDQELPASSSNGFVFRYSDNDNLNAVLLSSGAGGYLAIYDRSGGTWTERANVTGTGSTSSGTLYTITGSISGTSVTANDNGSECSYGSLSVNPTSTIVGFRAGSAGAGTGNIDNLTVTG